MLYANSANGLNNELPILINNALNMPSKGRGLTLIFMVDYK
jgi:hypothetical protein